MARIRRGGEGTFNPEAPQTRPQPQEKTPEQKLQAELAEAKETIGKIMKRLEAGSDPQAKETLAKWQERAADIERQLADMGAPEFAQKQEQIEHHAFMQKDLARRAEAEKKRLQDAERWRKIINKTEKK